MTEKICPDYLPFGLGAGKLNDQQVPAVASSVVTGYTPADFSVYGNLLGIDAQLLLIQNGALALSGAIPPTGVTTPTYIGQIYVDTAAKQIWVSTGLTDTDWELTGGSGLPAGTTGDTLVYNGTNWVPNRVIGAGHVRNTVGTSALLGGQNGVAYPGDGISPYTAELSVAVAGSNSVLVGNSSFAISGGQAYGELSIAHAIATAAGGQAVGLAGGSAGGNKSLAVGDSQAGGHNSMAVGENGAITGLGLIAVTLSNSGPDLLIVIPGEEAAEYIVPSPANPLRLFRFTGGTHNPLTHPNVLDVVADSVTVSMGNTEVTVLGVNTPATAATLAIGSIGRHSFAFGNNVVVRGSFSRAHGKDSAVRGNSNDAFGDNIEIGEIGLTPQPSYAYAHGSNLLARHNYARVYGARAASRNDHEHVHAANEWSAVSKSQVRRMVMSRAVGAGEGVVPLNLDPAEGTEMVTAAGHGYFVRAMVVGTINLGGANREVGAWRIEALFRNVSGTLTQVGSTVVQLIGNDDATKFDTAPAFGISGQNIRVMCADDGTSTYTVNWAASVEVVENGG